VRHEALFFQLVAANVKDQQISRMKDLSVSKTRRVGNLRNQLDWVHVPSRRYHSTNLDPWTTLSVSKMFVFFLQISEKLITIFCDITSNSKATRYTD